MGIVPQAPEILVNPSGDSPIELSDQEKEEIMVGQNKMQEIIVKVVADARDQTREQISYWDQDSDQDNLFESEEEGGDEGSSIYEYPGSEGDMPPKGRRQ